MRFNTVSGKHCCNASKIFRYQFWIVWVSIPQAVSAVAILPPTKRCYRNCTVSIPQAVRTFTLSFSPLFGQGLEICGPHRHFIPLLPRTLRRIPQAVSTVATRRYLKWNFIIWAKRFNTASGRYCCNDPNKIEAMKTLLNVSIPQAVGTVATL